ncbi:PPOX class F420-dependent oxidoreductase [Salinactinospora qingdaonensis]|uniref:Pyridoxamine 5'-phosphate oxidase n=1 Tax=Salinactinospora qingdaonensis TaxID=702744 RepID=A0ABP7FG45_9ACTN
MSTAALLKAFEHYKTALLTTYQRDGTTSVDTPVRIVIDGDRVLFSTWQDSAKARRLHGYPVADLRPCTSKGHPTGSPIRGQVHLLEGAEAQRASRLLSRRHPVLQGWGVPLSHRLLRYEALHYELRPFDEGAIESAEGWPD